jgi:predicted CXXCH cytochrome family protein
VDVFGSDTTADVVMASSEQYYIGTDLSNDHPVGAACPSGNTEYNCSPTNVDLYTYNSSKYVECSSCHDPHDTTNGSFLKQAKASICQECHNK